MKAERSLVLISVKMAVLALIGLSAGAVVAGGIFAFLAIIGVYVRLMGKTGTKKHTLLFETFIILGGILGNLWDIYEFPLLMGHFFGAVFLAGSGLFMGIFVGCLVMSLAETLKALPTISRRIHLAVGLQYLIIAIAAGKASGSLLFFIKDMGS